MLDVEPFFSETDLMSFILHVGCNKRIVLGVNEHGEISTPLQFYTQPCQFQIIAPVGKRIQLNFIKIFNTDDDVNTKLKIYEGSVAGNFPSKIRSSGFSGYPFSFLSNSNNVFVVAEDRFTASRQWSVKFEYFSTQGKKISFLRRICPWA